MKLINLVKTLLIVVALLVNLSAFAATVTPATGGTAISADTTSASGGSGAWTALNGPTFSETRPGGELKLGSFVLTAPAGFAFNTASSVQILLLAGDSTPANNVNSTPIGGIVATATVTATTISFNINVATQKGASKDNTITWQGIQVRPTSGSPLANGIIQASGTSGISTIPNYGTLTEVVGAAKKLAFNVQPSNAVAGASNNPAITVQIQDQFGNLTNTNASTITLAIGTNPGGGTLTGTSATAVAGVATFSSTSINKTGNGYTLVATSGAFTNATSNMFNITPGSPNKLGFFIQPSNTVAGAIIPSVVVQIQDAFGNLVPTAIGNISVAIGTNPSGGTLSGTTTVSTNSGSATFNTLSINLVGSGYTLLATSVGLTSVVSNGFNILSSVSNFDAVEVGAARATNLYTKLAGVGFSVDILALNSSNAISTTYAGTITVKLVDASTGGGVCGNMTVLQNIGVTSFSSGRMTVSLAYANAARNVKIRINDASAGVTACSTDNFSIRPTGFTSFTSSMTNTTATGTPSLVAGSGTFTLTADTGLGGYDGMPKIDNTALQAHSGAIQNGVVSGVFAAATAGIATASTFNYSEVGNFRLLGSVPTTGDNLARGVYDDSFTAVDAGDCTNDFSNTLSGGKYGCKFGITANTGYFGRFYPASFSLTASSLSPACSPVSGFTYMGQSFTATATIQALNGASTPTITKNYNGAYATGTALFTAENSNNGIDLSSRLTVPAGAWSAGIYTLNTAVATFSLPSTTTADATWGPFDSLILGVRIVDADGPVLNARDMDPTTSGACVSCTHKALNTATKMRLGRLRLANAYGSELLSLAVPIEAQYWASAYYATNTLDSCTTIPASSIIYSNFQAPLAACATHTVLSGVMNGGRTFNNLTAPGSGKSGSVNLSINTGSVASGTSCTSAGAAVSATGASLLWFATSPSAKATFGLRKTPLIYLRENF